MRAKALPCARAFVLRFNQTSTENSSILSTIVCSCSSFDGCPQCVRSDCNLRCGRACHPLLAGATNATRWQTKVEGRGTDEAAVAVVSDIAAAAAPAWVAAVRSADPVRRKAKKEAATRSQQRRQWSRTGVAQSTHTATSVTHSDTRYEHKVNSSGRSCFFPSFAMCSAAGSRFGPVVAWARSGRCPRPERRVG